jgi:hypothetical protein
MTKISGFRPGGFIGTNPEKKRRLALTLLSEPMRLCQLRLSAKLLLLLVLPLAFNLAAVSYDELRAQPDLTPEKFAAHFKKFEFRFRSDVQEFGRFLKTRSGDCDDFSTLADDVLKARGYTTRLVSIRMNDVIHVVCYVKEAGGYLDYNFRKQARIIPCDDDLGAIARQVGRFYQRQWTSASEFTYAQGLKRLVTTVREQGPTLALLPGANVHVSVSVSEPQAGTTTFASAP